MSQSNTDTAARALAAAFVLLTPIAFAVVVLTLGMDANWDLRNYHYYIAYSFLGGRHGWDMLPAQVATFYNPLIDVPFFLAAETLPARAVGMALGAIHGLNAVLLFLLARALWRGADPLARNLTAAATALVGVTGGGALSEVGTVFYDNVVSLGVFASAVAVVTGWRRPHHQSWAAAAMTAMAAGVPVGLACGLKQPTVVFAVGLCAAFLVAPGRPLRRLAASFWFGIGVLAGLAVTDGFWLAFLWKSYGNPLFPYFNQYFKSPMALADAYRDTQYTDPPLLTRLLAPWYFSLNSRVASEIVFRDWRIFAAFLAVPVGLLAVLARAVMGKRQAEPPTAPAPTIWLLAAMVLAYLAWVALFGIYRYLIPLEMLAPLLVVAAVGTLPLPPPVRRLTSAAVLVALMVSTVPGDWIRVPWQDKWVSVTVPPLPHPDDTLVVMAGHEPMSFMIPSFPAGTRFIRIDSTFTNPSQTGVGLNDRMRAIIEAHKGDLMVLYIPMERHDVLPKLTAYGLELDSEGCTAITSPIGSAPYDLCPLRRLPKTTVRR